MNILSFLLLSLTILVSLKILLKFCDYYDEAVNANIVQKAYKVIDNNYYYGTKWDEI